MALGRLARNESVSSSNHGQHAAGQIPHAAPSRIPTAAATARATHDAGSRHSCLLRALANRGLLDANCRRCSSALRKSHGSFDKLGTQRPHPLSTLGDRASVRWWRYRSLNSLIAVDAVLSRATLASARTDTCGFVLSMHPCHSCLHVGFCGGGDTLDVWDPRLPKPQSVGRSAGFLLVQKMCTKGEIYHHVGPLTRSPARVFVMSRVVR